MRIAIRPSESTAALRETSTSIGSSTTQNGRDFAGYADPASCCESVKSSIASLFAFGMMRRYGMNHGSGKARKGCYRPRRNRQAGSPSQKGKVCLVCWFEFSSLVLRLLARITSQKRTRRRQHPLPGTPLTGREVEVLQMLANGMSNKQIAPAIGLSIRTVESHRNHIRHKMKFESFSDLMRFAIRNHLVEP
jgi:DNA-binding CsgD family transcriptional regulator